MLLRARDLFLVESLGPIGDQGLETAPDPSCVPSTQHGGNLLAETNLLEDLAQGPMRGRRRRPRLDRRTRLSHTF